MNIGTATFNFTGAKVLVTGGTSGIGFATATAFADAGANVTITGTRLTAAEYDDDLSRFSYRQLRVTDNAEIKSVAASLDGLDVLVNNAGNVKIAGRKDDPVDVFEDMVRVHLLSAHHMTQACLAMLTDSNLHGGASVVGIASLTSFIANPFVPGYGAGKAGLVQLARTQAALWSTRGIRSNCVAAGHIHTRMTAPIAENDAFSKGILERTPMQRWGKPSEVADAVLFLSSSRAAFITGETLVVDGGYLFNT
jgi:3-oxoacyl-[acyl-carrier protein] reductase